MGGVGKAWVRGGAAGALFALCWTPLGIAPLLPLAFVLLIHAVSRAERLREAVAVGLAQGIAQYIVGAHFFIALTRYSWAGAVALYVAVILHILPFSVVQACGAYLLRRRAGLPVWAGVGLLWTLSEYARTLGDTSFPADLTAHAFGTHPAWLAWNGWIGPFGFTLLAFAVAAALHTAVRMRSRQRTTAALLATTALAVWLAPPLTDMLGESGEAKHDSLQIAIVQPNIAVQDKLNPRSWPELWRRLAELSQRVAAGADLVVWPETTRPGPLKWVEGRRLEDPQMLALAERLGVPILYGCEIARMREGRPTALYNAVALVEPGQHRVTWYGKQHLLPFVEGMPFADIIGWDPAERARAGNLSLIGNFKSGPELTIFAVGDARIGAMVCFEGMYPSLGRDLRMRGADALVLVTNDAWWGTTVFPRWHAQMVAARARELGVPVIRAANSGVSSATDSHGRLLDSTGLAQATSMTVDLRPSRSGPTFYARHGSLVPWLIVLTLAGFLVRGLALRFRLRHENARATLSTPHRSLN